jgi:hypothetical protein
MIKIILPLLLFCSTGKAQIAPVLNYSDYIKCNFFRDSVSIDTVDLKGSFMQIKFDSVSITVIGLDTLHIVSVTQKPDSVLLFVLNKINKTDSANWEVIENITAVLTPDYFYLEYPRLRLKRGATDPTKPGENIYTCYNFTLVRQMKSVSN